MSAMKTKLAAVEALEKKYGKARADDMVKEARNLKHPLHDDFPWDDKIAAHQHRLDIARGIISSVRTIVTVENRRITSVGYIRDPRCASDEQGYISVAKIRNDYELSYEALLSETSRIKAALERTRELAAALSLEDELNEILNGVLRMQDRARKGSAKPSQQPSVGA